MQHGLQRDDEICGSYWPPGLTHSTAPDGRKGNPVTTPNHSGIKDSEAMDQRAPGNVAQSAGLLVSDIASTLVFLGVLLVTHDIRLAVAFGMVTGIGQIVWAFWRGRRIDFLQWMSLVLVLVSGSIALLTNDPRIVMAKPSVIYICVGVVMLKPGWMTRYLPPIAATIVPDVAFVFGYLWAAMMFLTAAMNLIFALYLDAVAWSEIMSAFAIGSKVVLFLVQYAAMRFIGGRRRRGAVIM
jgi:intracellular septation protein